MDCAKTARAIIIIDNKLVSIKRTKIKPNGTYIYYTFPGGHVENDETFEETLLREVYEELGIEVEIIEEFESLYNDDLDKYEKFFICNYVSGKIGTGTGEEWQNVDIEKYGKYEIEYIEISNLLKYNLLPEAIKEKLYKKMNK